MHNLITYIIYTLIICTAILYIGHYCYRYGAVFIENALPHQPALVTSINKLLLTGYYLLNLGLSIYLISTWPALDDWYAVAGSLVYYLGQLLFLLGILHFFNMGAIVLFSKTKI